MIVHGFVRRDAPGLRVVETWDAQGMRATESHDTLFDGVFVADDDVLCVVPVGPSDHPAVGAMLVWALTLIANVYVGIAEQALELAIADAPALLDRHPRRHLRSNPDVQQQIAAMHLDLDAARATLERLAQDCVDGVPRTPLADPVL